MLPAECMLKQRGERKLSCSLQRKMEMGKKSSTDWGWWKGLSVTSWQLARHSRSCSMPCPKETFSLYWTSCLGFMTSPSNLCCPERRCILFFWVGTVLWWVILSFLLLPSLEKGSGRVVQQCQRKIVTPASSGFLMC